MVKKASRRLVYALSSSQTDTGGHSLGVNSLAIDPTPGANGLTGTLYSAGRDGIINGWGLTDIDVSTNWDTEYIPRPIDVKKSAAKTDESKKSPDGSTATVSRTQIHTNWVNDIILANNYQSGKFVVGILPPAAGAPPQTLVARFARLVAEWWSL
ncbi:hypothetical protein AWJ20_3201 [Sugiyamaella lignohabitans]|uniref:Uncharacterized protein n=1 Tax=Sugiyamaella lignohabitans TaxID=796027 RepID=A0A167FQM8_9ASCO|nr:uncharacterized protein AWJ20_3201 [Sugiyamaella lignohabitans]ANB15573.1 hypothetical protein AWJ20_3201 [Sugiyamaella lignohabitans]